MDGPRGEIALALLRNTSERSDYFSASSSMRIEPGVLDIPVNHLPRTSSSASSDTSIAIPNEAQVAGLLTQIFDSHATPANRDDLDALIEERAARLHELGETPESIRAVLSKGGFRDYAAQAAVGFVRSVPFAIASRAFDTIPALTSFAHTPAQVGAAVGGGSGVVDTMGATWLARATKDVSWLAAGREQLHPVMAEAKDAVKPSLARLAGEVGAAFQTYTVRNLLRTGVAPLARHTLAKEAAANVDSWIAAAGGPVAGASAYLAMQYMNDKAHRTGPEYLLGRTDWEQHYFALKHSGSMDPLKGVATRALLVPLSMATETMAGARKVFTATSLMANGGALAGGFAGVVAAQAAAVQAADHAGVGPVATAAIKSAVGTVTSAGVFGAWTTMDVAAGAAADAAAEGIRGLSDRLEALRQPTPPAPIQPPAHTTIDIPLQ